MKQEIINLYDEYTHKPLSRQEFLGRLSKLTGGMTAALAVLPSLEGNYAQAQTTAEDLVTEYITYPAVSGTMRAYVAYPAAGHAKAKKSYPAVVVIHENRGLNAHIEDVARRAAQAGFLAIAPNAISVLPDKPANEDEARALFPKLDPQESITNFAKAFDYLSTRKDTTGAFGCVGFCWGGAMANNLAVQVPTLKAAVAFYGRQPVTSEVPKIQAAVQLHYGGLDERVNEGAKAYVDALKAHGKTFEMYMYEGVNHAFHNDTSAARYDEKAATLAWRRTIDFFEKYVI
ncbi:dienelactone hydrolase family protein [Arundinibacter roseus]|uniref:Dienelactone hydrolase family protein n=1 Tax=Arundinibacter roseus TaxID=2070510 RepID=A0A4R4KHT5_9BACT|nr:dienelactone hydrolase family protein [Arundinibacter roseus]TDB67353.1 dienelactone hydrolase family protein [Arundinibacter roseus]